MASSILHRLGSKLGVQSAPDGRGFVVNPYQLAAIGNRSRLLSQQARRYVRGGIGVLPPLEGVAERLTLQRVPVDRLLLGYQAGLSGKAFAAETDDLMWTSTRLADGPHVELLNRAMSEGVEAAVGADFSDSPYGKLALNCMRVGGDFFGNTTIEGAANHARRFVESFLEGTRRSVDYENGSEEGRAIHVHPIATSDCYQVIDGHHRLARLVAQGVTEVDASVRGTPVTTALQDHLNSMTWLGGKREIYQPLDAPELTSEWPLVRKCTDRLTRMTQMVGHLKVADGATYLDVGACYGWFVASLEKQGFDAQGVEIDPMSPALAAAAYGLDPGRIATDDAVEFLRRSERPWDVVSCFSVLHHFVLGRGSCSPEEFTELLDRATGRVLFLDTGQDCEDWFKDSLPGWNPTYIREFLLKNTGFEDVIDLGPDEDRVVPFHHNYGRHLFACIR